MYDYQQHYTRQTIKREKKAYKKLLGIFNALLFASDEGVYEVTIRSQAGAIVVPVSLNDGTEITQLVVENFSRRLSTLESHLNLTIEEAGLEANSNREKEEAATADRVAQSKQAWGEYNEQTRAAAAQVAAGQAALAREQAAAPVPAVPSRRTARRVAQAAAAVPMNAAANLPTANVGEGCTA